MTVGGKRLRPRKEKLSVEVAVERRPGSNLAAAWVFQTPLESRDLRQPRVSAESPRSYAAAPEASFDCLYQSPSTLCEQQLLHCRHLDTVSPSLLFG